MKKKKKLAKKTVRSSPIRIGLSGASGRMGLAVKELLRKKNSKFTLVAKAPSIRPAQDLFKVGAGAKLQGVIDFSAPALFEQTLKWCVKHKVPLVSGTTALSPAQKTRLKKASQKIPVFYEENMSWGIWQIKKWVSALSHPCDSVLLEDIHHKHKKDKPSGTALKLKKCFPALAQKNLTVKSIRRGREFGTHRIIFQNREETVLLEHKALSRLLFAGGALKALKWLIKKPPGLYSFEDLYKNIS